MDMILEYAENLGVCNFVTSKDIIKGSPKLNTGTFTKMQLLIRLHRRKVKNRHVNYTSVHIVLTSVNSVLPSVCSATVQHVPRPGLLRPGGSNRRFR